MLNVFIENLNEEIKNQIKIARQHRLKDIKFIYDDCIRKSPLIGNIKDAIPLKGSTSGINSYCWNIETSTVTCIQTSFVLLAQLIAKDNLSCVLLDNNRHPKGCKSFFLDANHYNDLPDKFYNLPVFGSYADIVNYGVERGLVKSFSLEDKKKFQKTNVPPQQGQSVYKEIGTGYYWYLDNFHKDHYEVFDSTGKHHLYEADLNGDRIPNSKDLTKHIDI